MILESLTAQVIIFHLLHVKEKICANSFCGVKDCIETIIFGLVYWEVLLTIMIFAAIIYIR